MADVTSAATHAGGLGARPARWVFIFVWVCGAWLGIIDGYFTPLNILNASAYAAAFVGGLLLTTPGSHPLPPRRALWLPVIAFYMTVIALYRAPAVMDIWALDFAAYLVAFLIVRGNPVAGGIGSAVILSYALRWGLAHDPPAVDLMLLLGIPVGCMAAGIVWRLVLRGVVLKERTHRSAAARAAEHTMATDETNSMADQELADIRAAVGPLLVRISNGDPIDGAMRTQLTLAEAMIRDRIRAPHLQHPLLVSAVTQLRTKGVAVVVLGEPTHAGVIIDTPLAQGIVELIADVSTGRVTVRSLPEGRAAAASVVIQISERTEQFLIAGDGSILSRT